MQKEKLRINVSLKNKMTYPYRSAWAPPTCNFALKHATKPCLPILFWNVAPSIYAAYPTFEKICFHALF